MAKTKRKNDHIHLYEKIDLRPKWKQIKNPELPPYLVFQCKKPACFHHIPIARALGKICECNRCHNPMILDKETITLTKPHCQDCIVRKNKPEIDKLAEFLEGI